MADLAAIREGLAANLAPLEGFQKSAYLLSNPTAPAVEIEPGPTEYDKTFGRGTDEWHLIVRAFVAFTSDIGAQKKLDTCMESSGPTSIKALIESDPKLGGAVDDLQVKGCSGYKVFLREVTAAGRGSPAGPIIGAEWTVFVIAKGVS